MASRLAKSFKRPIFNGGPATYHQRLTTFCNLRPIFTQKIMGPTKKSSKMEEWRVEDRYLKGKKLEAWLRVVKGVLPYEVKSTLNFSMD